MELLDLVRGTRFVVPPDRPPRLVRLGLRVLALALAVFTVSTLVRPDDEPWPLLDTWLYNGCGVLGAVLLAARARLVRAERGAWLALAVAVACNAAGNVVYSAVVAGPDEPFPSVADAVYLGFSPCAYVALVLLLRDRVRGLPAALWVDGVAVGLLLATVSSALAFGPISASTGGSVAAVVVGLAYPLADLLLLAVTAAALVVLGARADVRWRLLATGLVLFAVADTVYLFQVAGGTYVEGTVVDALWAAPVVLFAAAGWHPARAVTDRSHEGRTVLVAPLFCTVVAVAVLVVGYDVRIPRIAVVLAAMTLVAVSVRLALTFREVSTLAESRRQALTDELTGLPNRRALLAALAGLTPAGGPGAGAPGAGGPASAGLLLLDLDRFKEINDSLGHHVGDELLRQLAARLGRRTRRGDVLARLGGDEFAVLLAAGTSPRTADEVAARLVEEMSAPFALDDVTLHVEASVGVALYPEHCQDPNLLLQRADVAMYRAKGARRRVARYRVEDDPHSRTRLETVEELRGALVRGELVCQYQPKLTLADGRVRSVEALVRWQHPTRGLLPPDAFLPLAEQTGLMRPLTLAVLEQAIGQARRWRAQGRCLTVAVNLSVTNLLDTDLPADVDRLLRAHDVPPAALVLEITESVLMADSERATSVVAALRSLGVGLSIDDYGTGYSSLAYLRDLAVDELKLDRTFVSRVVDDRRSAAIVRSTIDLAHSLGLHLVAEGVEDAATVELLRRYGCDASQGYHHSRPLPAEALERWLDTHEQERSAGDRQHGPGDAVPTPRKDDRTVGPVTATVTV